MSTEAKAMQSRGRPGVVDWVKSGDPMIWLNGAAVSLSVIAVLGLLLLLAVRGFSHFWPKDVMAATLTYQGESRMVMGEIVERVDVSGEQLREAGFELQGPGPFYQRSLLKQGNREFYGTDFAWLIDEQISGVEFPADVIVVERLEWGNFYGYLDKVLSDGEVLAEADEDKAAAWAEFQRLIAETVEVRNQIHRIERVEIGHINHQLERLRLRERRLELNEGLDGPAQADLAAARAELDAEYKILQEKLFGLYDSIQGYTYTARLVDGREVELAVSKVV